MEWVLEFAKEAIREVGYRARVLGKIGDYIGDQLLDEAFSQIDCDDFRDGDIGYRERIRVVSWNVHGGEDYRGLLDIFTGHSIIGSADVMLLQEAGKNTQKAGNRELGKCLASALGLAYVYSPMYVQLVDLPEIGTTGQAILSRYPIKKYRKHDASANNRRYVNILDAAIGNVGALEVEIGISPENISFVNVHLEPKAFGRTRLKQLRKCMGLEGKKQDDKAVVGGDFNTLFSKTEPLVYWMNDKRFSDSANGCILRTERALPWPFYHLDRIFYKGLRLAGFGVITDVRLSDHFPIFADFDIYPSRDMAE